MMHLCELHRAYNCQDETCKLLAQAGAVTGKDASDELEGFDDLLPQAEPATVLTLRPEPQPAKVAPVAAPVAAVPAPAKLTLKQPPAKPVATAATKDLLPAVPDVLKQYPNWVTHRDATKKGKAPVISGTERYAATDNPTTWVSYETACANIVAGKGYKNLGFVTDGERTGNLAGIDLDGSLNNRSGEITPWAQRVLDLLGPTYVEITPSGDGLRAWVVAVFPAGGNVFKLAKSCGWGDKVQVEVYSDARYFCVTGKRYGNSPSVVAPLADVDALLSLLRTIAAENPPEVEPGKQAKPKEKKSKRTVAVEKPGGGVVFVAAEPDSGFKKLFEDVGWAPLERRMDKMSDARYHGLKVEPGLMTYCPMPGHGERDEKVEYTECFGAIKDNSAVVSCFGCQWANDLVNTVREFDSGEDGGHVTYKNTYDVARAICAEEGLAFTDYFPTAAPATVAVKPAPTDSSENIKNTSLFIVGTAPEAELATSLGYHALVAAEFKPPLDSAFNRVALLGNSTDERFSDVEFSIPNAGARYVWMPRKFAWNLASVSVDEAAAFLNLVCNPGGMIADASVHKKRTRYVEVPEDLQITVVTNSTQSFNDVSDIPPFDTSVLEGNIYGKFVELVTKGTTLQPQYAYQVARLAISMLIIGRVQLENLADCPPLRRLVFIGATGSGKGGSWTRSLRVLTMNGRDKDKNFKYSDSIDSGVGLKDMFFDEPLGLPVMVYFDEVTSLGHKSSDKKNPDILDTMGELANKTVVSRTLSTHGRSGPKNKASKTRDDAYLFWLICAPDGMEFMCATAGRKGAGFNDRNIPVFGVPVAHGDLPEIPLNDIAAWWVEACQLQSMVGTKNEPGTVTMEPAAKAIIAEFWGSQPKAIQEKVRYKQYLLLDVYLNAIGRGQMTATVQDAENAIKDCKRELATRAVCFQEEASDRVGFYYASMKRLTAKMEDEIRKAGLNADRFEYGMSEFDFERDTRAYANNEPTPFAIAWKAWLKHLEPLDPRAAKNGRTVVRYVPARSEHDDFF